MADLHHIPRVFSSSARITIGLMGGSFNPAHEGHAHIADMAAQVLQLDQIWWLVSPQNPLKDTDGMAPFHQRLNGAIGQAKQCRYAKKMRISALERQLGTQLTFKTLLRLRQHMRQARLVWIMGGDNMMSFHRWHRPDLISATMAIAVINRPGARMVRTAPGAKIAGTALSPGRLRARRFSPKHWCYIQGRMSNQSATKIRAELAKPS